MTAMPPLMRTLRPSSHAWGAAVARRAIPPTSTAMEKPAPTRISRPSSAHWLARAADGGHWRPVSDWAVPAYLKCAAASDRCFFRLSTDAPTSEETFCQSELALDLRSASFLLAS